MNNSPESPILITQEEAEAPSVPVGYFPSGFSDTFLVNVDSFKGDLEVKSSDIDINHIFRGETAGGLVFTYTFERVGLLGGKMRMKRTLYDPANMDSNNGFQREDSVNTYEGSVEDFIGIMTRDVHYESFEVIDKRVVEDRK